MPWKCKRCGSREVWVTVSCWTEILWVGDDKTGSSPYTQRRISNDDDPDIPFSISCANREKVHKDSDGCSQEGCGNGWLVGTVELLEDHFERVER